ncbi:hypothetical protein MEO41_28760, partial [Dolichospermum sp. ST_sed4]|nr:hypothetical protein [Dolichospermum sp. ST_sed4]
NAVVANITPEMGVGFQIPIKNLVSILISTAVKTARVATLSGLKPLSFPLTGYSYDYLEANFLVYKRREQGTDKKQKLLSLELQSKKDVSTRCVARKKQCHYFNLMFLNM